MVKIHTSALFAAVGLLAAGSANAALTVAADFIFDDGTDLAAAGFTVNGDPSISGNALQLDGDGDWLTIADPLGGAEDNFVFEILMTPSAVGAFNFAGGRSAGTTNSGGGILYQGGNLNGLASLVGFFAATPEALNVPVSVSWVRQDGENTLYVDGVELPDTDAAEGFSNGGNPIDTLAIGAHAFDAPNGLFNGSIDRVRLSTIGANDLLAADANNDNFITVVPEPTSLALLALGGLIVARRRRG